MNRPSSRFLSQLAHDLRSPLNVIGSTLTELASESGPAGADRDQLVSLSQRAVGRLLSLSDRLALAARLDTPFEMAVAPVDLVKAAKDTLARFGAQVRQRIAVATAFPDTAMMVSANDALLAALLLELLTNANRFARRQFRVELVAGSPNVLTVDDDGEGVAEDERAVLFEPFAERRSRTGLGMGLWLARRLAELHGGTLTVEHLAVGTRQRLTLPSCT